MHATDTFNDTDAITLPVYVLAPADLAFAFRAADDAAAL